MKRLLILFACLPSMCVMYSQDIITQKDGTDIQAKVTEVGLSEISYKKYSNLDGPTYIISKDDVLMITYENGEREIYAYNIETSRQSALPQGMMTYNSWSGTVSVGGVTMENEMLERYFTPEDYKLFVNGKNSATGGLILSIIGAVPLGWSLGTYAGGGELNKGMLIGGGLVTLFGIVVNSVGEDDIRKAISHYNSSLSFAPTINFGATANDLGLGLALVIHF